MSLKISKEDDIEPCKNKNNIYPEDRLIQISIIAMTSVGVIENLLPDVQPEELQLTKLRLSLIK